MTEESHYHLVSKLKPRKIILPVILGLAVVVWLISKEFNTDTLSKLVFTWKSVFWLLIAWLMHDREGSWLHNKDKDPDR